MTFYASSSSHQKGFNDDIFHFSAAKYPRLYFEAKLMLYPPKISDLSGPVHAIPKGINVNISKVQHRKFSIIFFSVACIHQVWMVFAKIGNGLCFCYQNLNLHSVIQTTSLLTTTGLRLISTHFLAGRNFWVEKKTIKRKSMLVNRLIEFYKTLFEVSNYPR